MFLIIFIFLLIFLRACPPLRGFFFYLCSYFFTYLLLTFLPILATNISPLRGFFFYLCSYFFTYFFYKYFTPTGFLFVLRIVRACPLLRGVNALYVFALQVFCSSIIHSSLLIINCLPCHPYGVCFFSIFLRALRVSVVISFLLFMFFFSFILNY